MRKRKSDFQQAFLSSIQRIGSWEITATHHVSLHCIFRSKIDFRSGVSRKDARSLSAKQEPIGDDWSMRAVSPSVQERQERALVLALAGLPIETIAATLNYATVSGAWKATRAAAARKVNLHPKTVQAKLSEREMLYRSEWHTRALQDLLAGSS